MSKKRLDEARRKWYKAKVVQGQGKGKQLGFPTANLQRPKDFKLKYGIYTTRLHDGRKGILYWGTRGGDDESLEIHIFDFDGDLYGHELQFQIGDFIREDRRFDSDTILVLQIKDDIKKAKELI